MGGIAIVYIEGVYQPSHDSAILLNTVEHVIKFSKEYIDVALEIGCGTGYVTAKLLSNNDLAYAILIDVDPKAVYSTWETMKINKVDGKADVVQCDGASCVRSRAVNLVYFNPPYLPVCDEISDAIAWNGGEDGLEIWAKFFKDSLNICKNSCVIAFVFSTLQRVEEIIEHVLKYEYVEIFDCEQFFYEMLCGAVVKYF